MILVELYLIKSVVAWAATIKGVQLSLASADETFKEVRRKTAHIHATLHNALLDHSLPADVRQAVTTVQGLLQHFDDILDARSNPRSALTSLPRKLNEAEELHALESELNAALERLQQVCALRGISIDDDIGPSPEPPEDFSPADPADKPTPPGVEKPRLPQQEVVDSIVKQKKERKQIIPEFIRHYIPTWEMIGYRCRTSNS